MPSASGTTTAAELRSATRSGTSRGSSWYGISETSRAPGVPITAAKQFYEADPTRTLTEFLECASTSGSDYLQALNIPATLNI